MRTIFCTIFSTLFAVSLFAQDPDWHKVPKDDLTGNRGEIAKTLLATTDENVMLSIMQRPETDEPILYLKMLAGKRLGVYGTKNAVPTLVSMLDNEKDGFFARYALETIPGPEVDAAICAATKNLKRPAALAGTLTTLGVRKNSASAATAKEFLAHSDPEVAKAAAYAFASCDPDGAVVYFTQKNLDSKQIDSGFLLAEEFAKTGKKDHAVKIYDALMAVENAKPYQKESALYWWIKIRELDGLPVLSSELNSPSLAVFGVALKAGRELPAGDAVTKAMIGQLDKLPADRKALLVRAIGDRTDKESKAVSLPVIAGLARSGDETVCIAAIDALNNIGDLSVLPVLIDAVKQTVEKAVEVADKKSGEKKVVNKRVPSDVALAAKRVLADLEGKEVDAAIVELLAKGDSAGKIAAIGLIQERRIVSAFPLLKQTLKDSDAEVRKAALDAIGQVSKIEDLPMLLSIYTENTSEDQAEDIQNVLFSACTRMPKDAAAIEVSKLIESSPLPVKLFLFDLLKEIGGREAMKTVEAYAWGDSPELKDKATSILGQWRSPQDIDLVAAACLKLARESKEPKFKIRGLRGYIRLARQFTMSEERRIAICKDVLELSDRNEDKILVFEVYARNPSLKMLDLAIGQADDEAFREKACEASVLIGEKLQGKSPKTAEAMKKVMEKSKNELLKNKAKIVLDRQ